MTDGNSMDNGPLTTQKNLNFGSDGNGRTEAVEYEACNCSTAKPERASLTSPILEQEFSDSSYGFRPGRSAHDAIHKAVEYVKDGYVFVVDLDLEKFFDRVNHDILMARVACYIKDKRLLKLIRAFLNAGVMADGVVHPRNEGTPQGGPLKSAASKPYQRILFDDDVEPAWVEVDANGIHVERCMDFGGPWLSLELLKRLGLAELFENQGCRCYIAD
jgi:hypothetical protein